MVNLASHIDYEEDGYGWAMEQSALIRAGRISELDLKNIASKKLRVEVQRIRLNSHMRGNPSLKSILDDAVMEAFRIARLDAETETDMNRDIFPLTRPYSLQQMMDEEFWPNIKGSVGI